MRLGAVGNDQRKKNQNINVLELIAVKFAILRSLQGNQLEP